MNKATLKRGKTLSDTIDETKLALANMKKLKLEKVSRHNSKSVKDNSFDDGLYTLYIGEHSDLSGHNASLERYGGNMELLDVIIETLGNQLDAYETEFDSM
jgi:hypothetical protein